MAKSTEDKPYWSIKVSKENNAFIRELRPESTYWTIEGKNYPISEAWIEHPHQETNTEDILDTLSHVFVMNIDSLPMSIALFDYTKSFGNTRVWFWIPDSMVNKDTFTLYYRNTLTESKKKNKFLLFRK